jgi:hypothetical protein
LDEPFQPTIVTDIVNNCDDFNNIVKSTEVKAQSSTSAKRINEDDTCISLFATDEYVPALKAGVIDLPVDLAGECFLFLSALALFLFSLLSFFLAHLAIGHVSFCHGLASVVHPSISFSHLNLLL